jgi:hypothetical protein
MVANIFPYQISKTTTTTTNTTTTTTTTMTTTKTTPKEDNRRNLIEQCTPDVRGRETDRETTI